MTDDQKRGHLQAVIDELPAHLKKQAFLGYGGELNVGDICIEIDHDWYNHATTMKATPCWSLTHEVDAKMRRWKHRQRDSKFSYNLVAKYVTKVLGAMQEIEDRRKKGKSIATRRAAVLEAAFKQDSLLAALNLNVKTKAAHNTEIGEVDVSFRGKNHVGTGADLKFNGQKFHGHISVHELSAEQVTALMTVLRVDQLNILDMIAFADDSILGPSIRKLTEEMGNA